MSSLFAFSFAWGLGGSLELQDKEKFDSMVIKDLFKIFPAGNTAYDYYFDMKKDKVFKPWSNKM